MAAAFVLFGWLCVPLHAEDVPSGNAAPVAARESTTQEPAQSPSVPEIREIWHRRMEAITACRVEWVVQWSYGAEFALLMSDKGLAQLDAMTTAEHDELAKRDLIHCEQEFSFLISGSKIRLERWGQRVRGLDDMVTFRTVSAADGQVSKSLEDPTDRRAHPAGIIYNHASSDTVMEVATLPVRASCSPLESTVSGIPALETLTPEPMRPDEPDLFALTETAPAGNRRNTFVFDRSKQFQLVRSTSASSQPQPLSEFDIRYQYHPDAMVWLPSAWTFTSFTPSGSISYALDARVTRVEINPVIDEDAFSLEFPAGTMVSDYRPDSEGYDPRFRDAAFIVKPDGGKRIVTHSERHEPYNALLQDEPPRPQSPAERRGIGFWLLIAINAVVVTGIAGRMLLRRRRP
jgi:hypothetical protein